MVAAPPDSLRRTARLASGAIPSGLFALLVACAGNAAAQQGGSGAPAELRDLMPDAAQRVCNEGLRTPPLSSARTLGSETISAPDARGAVQDWRLDDGRTLRVSRLETRNGRVLFFVDAYAGNDGGNVGKPLLRGVIDGRCNFLGGQDVLYEDPAASRPLALQRLGPDMQPSGPRVPLNPPVPEGAGDPACLRVAVLDNGVNYLLPEIAGRLARGSDGRLVGHDFWEEDDRPFDYGAPPGSLDPRVSVFSPRRHGTGVASVLLADAPPQACIAPYRYLPAQPPGGSSDPRKMAAEMAKAGIRIVNLSSGRDRPWPEFRQALEDNPDMLFVVAAGNEGRDLGQRPSYPSAYRLDNIIVVAATESDGWLWQRSNRGPVDVAAPAVDLRATVADGRVVSLTGTSLAAPRVAALAARLLVEAPQMSAAALKAAIIERARASGVATEGGIPVLTEESLKAR